VLAAFISLALGRTAQAQERAPAENEDAVYAYTDDQGRLVHVQRLADVPPWLRAHARRVDTYAQSPSAPGSAADGDMSALFEALGRDRGTHGQADLPVLYRYRTAQGRTTYTNLPASVPLAQRANARLDLSRVSLNSPLGAELDRKLNAEHARLVEQPRCRQLRSDAATTLPERLWKDHKPLLVFGLAILGFVFVTPWMLRRVGGREWARTLSMAVPALVAAGVFTYAALESSRTLRSIQALAAPCGEASWSALARQEHGLIKRFQLLQGMHAQSSALEQIAQEAR
jgi:hypothetical protein